MYPISEVVDGFELDQFQLVFEPQIDLRREAIVGIESLVRWHHPTDGIVAPAHFLPQIESSGLSSAVTQRLFTRLLGMRKRLRMLGYSGRLSLNISSVALEDEQLPGLLARIAADHSEPLAGLVLELTETQDFREGLQARDALRRLAAAGIELSLDDFWTGYSSLEKLHLGEFAELKIDRQLTAVMLDNRIALAGVVSIITFARNVGWRCVAEGIETLEQRQCLSDLGCEIGQGFLFSYPVSESDVAALVRRFDDEGRLQAPVAAGTGPAAPAVPYLTPAEICRLSGKKSPVFAFDLDAVEMVWANAAALEFWRAESVTELVNRDFLAGLSTTDRTRLLMYRQTLAARSHIAEAWTFHPPGAARSALCTFEARLRDNGNTLVLVDAYDGFTAVPIPYDVREFVRANPAPSLALSTDGRVLWKNANACVLFGDGVGGIETLCPDPDSAAAFLRKVAAEGEGVADLLVRTRCGTSRHRVLARSMPAPGGDGWAIVTSHVAVDDLRAGDPADAKVAVSAA